MYAGKNILLAGISNPTIATANAGNNTTGTTPIIPQPGGSDSPTPTRTLVKPILRSSQPVLLQSQSDGSTGTIPSSNSSRRIIGPLSQPSIVTTSISSPLIAQPYSQDQTTHTELDKIVPVSVSVPTVKSVVAPSEVDNYFSKYFEACNEVKKLKMLIIQWNQNLYKYRIPSVKERITIMITKISQLYIIWKKNQLNANRFETIFTNMISSILDNLLGLIKVATSQNNSNETRLIWFNQAYQQLIDYVKTIDQYQPNEHMFVNYMSYLAILNDEINNINNLLEQMKINTTIPQISIIIDLYLSLVKIAEIFYPLYLHLTELIYYIARNNCPIIGISTQTATNHYRMICSYSLTDRCQNRPGACPYSHQYSQLMFEGDDPIFTWTSPPDQSKLVNTIISKLSSMSSTPTVNRNICHHWASNGICMLGSSCKFDHPTH